MYLYPRLPHSLGREIVKELANSSIQELEIRSGTSWDNCTFAPTGGMRINDKSLQELQTGLTVIARELGYPGTLNQSKSREFDRRCAIYLYETMLLSASEATSSEVWSYIGCILVPHLVRWRFPSKEGTTAERFLGGVRGGRNTFGRLWWRACVFKAESSEDPFSIIKQLGEDDAGQIMERPSLAGNRRLAQTIASFLLGLVQKRSGLVSYKKEIMRDLSKRLRRKLSVISFEALDDEAIKTIVKLSLVESMRNIAPDEARRYLMRGSDE